MKVTIVGVNPPGRVCGAPDGTTRDNVHVGVQVRKEPEQIHPADSDTRWELDIDVVRVDGELDFRGPAVHGKRGDRFLYLTWGQVDGADFAVFGRAKLMLDRIDPAVLDAGVVAARVAARVDLTDDKGAPRCARVDPPAIQWSVPRA